MPECGHIFNTTFHSEDLTFKTSFDTVIQPDIEKQEKTLEIDKNGSYEVYPDDGCLMSKVVVEANVPERKEEQKEIVKITENDTYFITPEEGKVFSEVVVEVDVGDAERYEGSYNVTPTFEEQKLETKNRVMREDLVVTEIPISRVSNTSGGNTIIIGG